MKKRTFAALLAALLLTVSGCTATPTTQETPTNEEIALYTSRIAELEATLQKERENRFISDSAYEGRIQELEQQLLALSPDAETGSDITDETMIFHYRLEGNKAIVTGYDGTSTLVTVPSTLDGYAVIAIGERAFEGTSVAAVILPQGLEAIGWFAFYGCEKLIDVSIPASVTSIGYAVFDGCPNIAIVCGADTYAARYAESYGLPRVIL